MQFLEAGDGTFNGNISGSGSVVQAGSGSLTGAMKLYKTGSGRLTLGNTNTYTGGTFVSGGSLFVNGTLAGSAVTVERRGTPEGP